MAKNVDLVVEATEGVSEVVIEKTAPKLVQKIAQLPVIGKVALGVGAASIVALGVFGAVKGFKFVKAKFFTKEESADEAVEEATQEAVEETVTE